LVIGDEGDGDSSKHEEPNEKGGGGGLGDLRPEVGLHLGGPRLIDNKKWSFTAGVEWKLSDQVKLTLESGEWSFEGREDNVIVQLKIVLRW
jgi:hypothetical protein